MGINISQANQQLNLSNYAHMEVHKYLFELLPLLEYRKQLAARMINLTTEPENAKYLLKDTNNAILKTLRIKKEDL